MYKKTKYYVGVSFMILFLVCVFSCKQKTVPKSKMQIGIDAPDFSLPDRNDVYHRLSEYKNKTILLDFWASWCAPCRRKNKEVVAIYNAYKNITFTNGSTFEIISISQDNQEAAWLKAIEEDGLVWENHLKQRMVGLNEASLKYDVQYIPCCFLINASGKIMLVNPSKEELEETLNGLK
jgi:thiol-disulfide isomerase/thioredoxin